MNKRLRNTLLVLGGLVVTGAGFLFWVAHPTVKLDF